MHPVAADSAIAIISPTATLAVQRPGAPLPDRTLADLLAEVILRGKSPQTRKAYRTDLEDFLVRVSRHMLWVVI